MDKLIIAGREFSSRLFLGTGKFNNNELMAKAIEASGTEMVTVAMKRIELDDENDELLTSKPQPILAIDAGANTLTFFIFLALSFLLAQTGKIRH